MSLKRWWLQCNIFHARWIWKRRMNQILKHSIVNSDIFATNKSIQVMDVIEMLKTSNCVLFVMNRNMFWNRDEVRAFMYIYHELKTVHRVDVNIVLPKGWEGNSSGFLARQYNDIIDWDDFIDCYELFTHQIDIYWADTLCFDTHNVLFWHDEIGPFEDYWFELDQEYWMHRVADCTQIADGRPWKNIWFHLIYGSWIHGKGE
eukprot:1107362_1